MTSSLPSPSRSAAVVASLAKAASIGEVYHLTGAERLSWPQSLAVVRDQTGGNHGVRPWGIPGPVAAVVASAAGAVGLGKFLPFDRGMALMGAEDSVSEKGAAARCSPQANKKSSSSETMILAASYLKTGCSAEPQAIFAPSMRA